MTAYQMAFLGLNKLTQQGIVQRINENARGMNTPLQGELYNIKYDGRRDTPEKVDLHLKMMRVKGQGAYVDSLLNATKNPVGLSDYLPDDTASRGLQPSLPIAEFSRNQLHLPPAMQRTNPNTGKEEKKYHRSIYSYAKYAGAVKSAAKTAYGKVESKSRNMMAKIRSVYQSSRGFFKNSRQYGGQDMPANVVSLDAYRAAKERIKYAAQSVPDQTLEQKVA